MTATGRADRLRNDEKILRAASVALAADPGASMQAIADLAGVARLSVYRRYPDRNALLTALRAAADAELTTALNAVPPWMAGPATFTSLISALAGVAERYPIAILRYTQSSGDAPPVADARIAALLHAGQEAGVLRPDIPAATLNLMIFGILAAIPGTTPNTTSGATTSTPAAISAVLLHGMATSGGDLR